MTKRKTTQSTKEDEATDFAAQFFTQWQEQWQEMLKQNGMNAFAGMGMDNLGLSPGFIPLQNIGPMGMMAPMGAVALANLKIMMELQERVARLEEQLGQATKKTKVKKPKA